MGDAQATAKGQGGSGKPETKNRVAFRYETEAFALSEKRIMGRQSAGHAFLRAAVAANPEGEVFGYGPNPRTGPEFAKAIGNMDARCKGRWVMANRQDQLAALGALHRPDPLIGRASRARLRMGPEAYSITGVTHTTATAAVMQSMADLPVAPVMPWDAVICTSNAVHGTVTSILETQEDFLAWRTGGKRFTRPQLPVIPLGVHCDDFEITEEEQAAARTRLNFDIDAIVFLFTGRLSFHGKAHPYQMYRALEDTARKSGKPVVLVQCGWFANSAIEKVFKESSQAFAPSVRHVFLDGRNPEQRRTAWAAADVFISLSDNIQETFGLTLIEAMATGLPVIATAWDGYRDTVRHGQDGFLIPTAMPEAGFGTGLANHFASETINYDHYLGLTSQYISVDSKQLKEAAFALATQPDLRRKMGKKGQKRARQDFDWSHIYRRYEELWNELASRRKKAPSGAGLKFKCSADEMDPFHLFSNYASAHVSADTLLSLAPDAPVLETIVAASLFPFSGGDARLKNSIEKLRGLGPALEGKPVQEICTLAEIPLDECLRAVSFLLKVEFFRIHDPAS